MYMEYIFLRGFVMWCFSMLENIFVYNFYKILMFYVIGKFVLLMIVCFEWKWLKDRK